MSSSSSTESSTSSASISASSSSTESSTSSATSTTTSLSGLGLIDFDLLAVQGLSIHLPDGVLSCILLFKGDKGVSLAGIVNIGHGSKLLKLRLEFDVLEVLVNSIDKQLASVAHVKCVKFYLISCRSESSNIS